MAFGFYFGKDVLNRAVGSDDESGAGDAHDFLAIHVFLLDNAVGFGNLLVGVSEEGKWKLEFILKFLLGFGRIGRDAEENGAGFLNLAVGVAEGAGFDGASGGIGTGVEIEDDDFAAEALERNFFAVLVLQSKVRGLIIDVEGTDICVLAVGGLCV
jgi:hypothetical protein